MTSFNIQFIDGAINCTHSIFSTDEASFRKIFPDDHQDVEFIEDFCERVGDEEAQNIMESLNQNPVMKCQANGIHGTLYFQLPRMREFYLQKRECDITGSSVSENQRKLFRRYKKENGLS